MSTKKLYVTRDKDGLALWSGRPGKDENEIYISNNTDDCMVLPDNYPIDVPLGKCLKAKIVLED